MTPNRRARAAGSSALLALATILAISCEKPPGDPAQDFRASVAAQPVTKGKVERLLTTTGTVRAREQAKIVAQAGGQVQILRNPATGRRWAIGDAVKQGQLLAIVAAEDLRTSSRAESRKDALALAQSEFDRNKRLREEGLLSETQLADFESRLSSARAEYENALLQQSKARAVAPLTGVLTQVTTAADGELVAERTLIAEVMRFDEVLVDLDLGAGDVLGVEAGLPVRIEAPSPGSGLAIAADPLSGVVERVAPAIDPVSRTFRVEVGIDNAAHRLRPGMFVRADIVLDSRHDVLVVPAQALVNRNGKWAAFVVEAQMARLRPVEIGLSSDSSVEILSGLAAGDLVVTSGQETLADGARVNVRQ